MDAEKILAIAVRDKIRLDLSIKPEQCHVELDETMPAIAYDTQINVIPNGVTAGPLSGPGITDLTVRISVFIAIKTRNVPRDRRRDIYLRNLTGLSDLIEAVREAVHGNYFATEIAGQSQDACNWPEPLVFTGVEGRPKLVFPANYDSEQNTACGFGRLINFGKARYLKSG